MNSSDKPRSATARPLSVLLWIGGVVLACSTVTRIVLLGLHYGELSNSIAKIVIGLADGFVYDLFVSICLLIPTALFLTIFPPRWKRLAVFKWLTVGLWFLFVFANLYLIAAEAFFFDEFSARFNYVAVDYLIYPHEVFVNIWDTYPVLKIIIAALVICLIVMYYTKKRLFDGLAAYPSRWRVRLGIVGAVIALAAAMFFVTEWLPSRISDNRVLNEVSSNGVYSFFNAAFTNEMDYNQYYETMGADSADSRLKSMLNDANSSPIVGSSMAVERHVKSDNPINRFNIVLILEESLSYEFVGGLEPGGKRLTPRIDSLIDNGMVFSHVYATGNRTVRGLEASLLSFPPIPGRSIVKRPGGEDVFSLPALLKQLDYNTIFLYGGLSYFDNFGHFASTNGFDQVVDEVDFENPVYKTIWGVCDEDLFGNSLAIFDTLASKDKPFFATMITVSNHSPYTYPKGRIPYDPDEQKRDYSVRYADYALGKFIADARSHEFFDSTLFIVLADHGARVYGSEQIPLRSYRIPVLFYNPKLIPEADRVTTLGSQLDLAPTILDFLGFDYNSMFFGRSLLSTPVGSARAWMSHNRDVSLLKDDTLLVLNIQKGEQWWTLDSTGQIEAIEPNPNSILGEDAAAFYMTGYNMYRDHDLHPLEQAAVKQ